MMMMMPEISAPVKKEAQTRIWYLFVPRRSSFEEFSVSVQRLRIARTPDIYWYLAQVPPSIATHDRQWMVAEGGTGYILAFGADAKQAKEAARAKFNLSTGWTPADAGCYIRGQMLNLKKYFSNNPDFVVPKPETNPHYAQQQPSH